MSWQKYIKDKGINLGIDKFGESGPYKKVYKYFKRWVFKVTVIFYHYFSKLKTFNWFDYCSFWSLFSYN